MYVCIVQCMYLFHDKFWRGHSNGNSLLGECLKNIFIPYSTPEREEGWEWKEWKAWWDILWSTTGQVFYLPRLCSRKSSPLQCTKYTQLHMAKVGKSWVVSFPDTMRATCACVGSGNETKSWTGEVILVSSLLGWHSYHWIKEDSPVTHYYVYAYATHCSMTRWPKSFFKPLLSTSQNIAVKK